MTTTEWNIQPRAESCTQCQQPFADKQTYHTLLALTIDGYGRQDLCEACHAAADRSLAFSYWQAEFRVPPPPTPEPIQKDTAESLLRKLIEAADPADDPARYILAVMLERKRLLKHRDTVREDSGRELLVYEHNATGETFTLPDPHLRLDQLEAVQTRVIALLQPPAPPAPPAES